MREGAAVVNMATETIASMERALELEHPHLDSFYQVLALVFMSPFIAEVHTLFT